MLFASSPLVVGSGLNGSVDMGEQLNWEGQERYVTLIANRSTMPGGDFYGR